MIRFKRILWWGNVRALPVRDRAAFAARHGFDALNVAPADIVALLEAGETFVTIHLPGAGGRLATGLASRPGGRGFCAVPCGRRGT